MESRRWFLRLVELCTACNAYVTKLYGWRRGSIESYSYLLYYIYIRIELTAVWKGDAPELPMKI